MTYRKHGINPRLISVASGSDLAEIVPSPTPAELPGSYAKLISKHIDDLAELPDQKQILICTACGRKGEYNLGMIFVNPDQVLAKHDQDSSPLDSFQFSGYFRCKHCNGAGAWDFPDHTRGNLIFAVMGGTILKSVKRSSNVQFGIMTTYDGHSFTWPSETEEHYLNRLQTYPSDAWTWNRLGNTYDNGGRPDLAAAAFQQSILHDTSQFESHFSLGRLLYGAGHYEESLVHMRAALRSARNYTRCEPLQLREALTTALRVLYLILEDPHKIMEEIVNLNKKEGPASSEVVMVDLSVNFETAKGIYPLAEMLMGSSQDLLPLDQRKLTLPKARPVHPRHKKPPKKKPKKR